MRKSVFVDTSAWLALVNAKDDFHARAVRIRNRLFERKDRLYVTEYVMLEVANSLSKLQTRQLAVDVVEFMISSPLVSIIYIDIGLFNEVWNFYLDRMDKEWSLTDCASFLVMQRGGIREAFACDHHFEQAGFHILL